MKQANILTALVIVSLVGAVVALIIDTNAAIAAAYIPFVALFVYGASLCKR
jgi:hypothetical protein